ALAGGVDSPVRAGRPVGAPTPFITRAHGSRVIDAEGREYIDYLCAYGPVLLGHGDARIAAAVNGALREGAVFGATHPEEVRLAERVKERFPSMDVVRFVSTGTEACMSAVRVTRAFTKREKVIRFEGCYHGQSDAMIFSAGASSLSGPTLASGIPRGVIDDVIVLPYNDPRALEEALIEHSGDVAAIIVEPVCGNMGLCLPAPQYLQRIRELSRCHRVVLILDEVITGLRLGPGGAQQVYGIVPDLTCIGKALGGGLPIAAFGGRAEIMAALAPEGTVFVGGTFSGNPTCVAAAHALLDALEADAQLYEHLSERTSRLARGLQEIIDARGLGYPVVACASMVDFMFRRGKPHRDMREAREADASAYASYYKEMLDRGILLPPSQMELMFVTAAHSDDDIDATLAAAREALS
ncbi:MAG TPA: glutamate-1-semialdehyde 2,1-aminomutase, partial [Candidatus Acidoferrales bacterium]|nr:glutamate-1-semialdehyde 2,1-aminomutase [Candidatus Acidoferrales bacterium]